MIRCRICNIRLIRRIRIPIQSKHPRRALIITALAATTRTAAAQDSTQTRPPASAVGISFGLPAYSGTPIQELETIGVTWTQLHPNRIGADLAVGTAPRALVAGIGIVGARADVVLPLEVAPSVYLLPAAGVSMIGVGSGARVFGLNAGAAVTTVTSRSLGYRVGVTVHHFQSDNNLAWLFEAGVVWSP